MRNAYLVSIIFAALSLASCENPSDQGAGKVVSEEAGPISPDAQVAPSKGDASEPKDLAPHPLVLRQLAILADAEVREAAISDLLMVNLSQDREIELVDREELEKVAKELELVELFGSASGADRLQVGRLLNANVLVSLTVHRAKELPKPTLRLVVSECTLGARLRIVEWQLDREHAAETAALLQGEIGNVLRQYRSGVQTIFAIPPLVSRNLVHDFDYLQSGYAQVLAAAVGSAEGVAVLEIEEARAIERELQLAGEEIAADRPVPIFVSGEFRMQAQSGEKVPVELTLELHKRDTSERFHRASLAFDDVPHVLSQDVANLLLKSGGAQGALAIDRQAELLAARAVEFAKLADWQRAIDVGEAALLLQEKNVPLRQEVLNSYVKLAELPPQWPSRDPADPRVKAIVQRGLQCILRAIDHREFFIAHRLIDPRVLLELDPSRALDLRDSRLLPPDLPILEREKVLQPVRQAIERFYEDRMVRLPEQLPPSIKPFERAGFVLRCSDRIADVLLPRMEPHCTRQDLDRFYEVMVDVLPDGQHATDVVMQRMQRLERIHYTRSQGNARPPADAASAEEIERLLDRLLASNHAVAGMYARYVWLQIHQQQLRQQRSYEQWVKWDWEMAQTMEEFSAIEFPPSEHGEIDLFYQDRLYAALFEMQRDTSRSFGPKLMDMYKKSAWASEKTKPSEQALPSGMMQSAGFSLQGQNRFSNGWLPLGAVLVSCGKADVIVDGAGAHIVPSPGRVGKSYASQPHKVDDVKWDGDHIWVAVRKEGLKAMDPNRKIVREIGPQQGLPPCDRKLLVEILSEGRLIVVGAHGAAHQAWCAVVDTRPAQPRVDVFYRSSQPRAGFGDHASSNADAAFRPAWIHRYDTGNGGDEQFLVGREDTPLLIDAQARTVAAFPYPRNSARYPGRSVCSLRGELFLADVLGIVRLPSPGAKSPQKASEIHYPIDISQIRYPIDMALWSMTPVVELQRRSLLLHEGWIYYAGPQWLRIRATDLSYQRLDFENKPPPLSIAAFKSSHYGLIQTTGGQMSRVRIVEDFDPDNPFGTSAPPQADETVQKNDHELKLWVDYRVWTDASGKYSIVATVCGMSSEPAVELCRKDGFRVEVPLAKLSAADRKLIEAYREKDRQRQNGNVIAGPDRPKMPRLFAGVQVATRPADVILEDLQLSLGDEKHAKRWLACGEEADVMWSSSTLRLMQKPGEFNMLANSTQGSYCDVKWDGQSIWVAHKDEGLQVFDSSGKLALKIGKEQGLPPSDHRLLVEPLQRGRAIAVGSFGELKRAWCAIVDITENKPSVRIIHEAKEVPTRSSTSPGANLAFVPSWIKAVVLRDGRQLVLIGRSYVSPRDYALLVIDPVENKALLCESDLAFDHELRAECIINHDGLVLARGFRYAIEYDGRSVVLRPLDNALGRPRLGAKGLGQYDGLIYLVGGHWYQMHLDSTRFEQLTAAGEPQRLDGFAQSAHYGLVAWGDGKLYRVKLPSRDTTSVPVAAEFKIRFHPLPRELHQHPRFVDLDTRLQYVALSETTDLLNVNLCMLRERADKPVELFSSNPVQPTSPVAWDGKYLWLDNARQGLHLFDESGNLAKPVGNNFSLPELGTTASLHIRPLGIRRAMIVVNEPRWAKAMVVDLTGEKPAAEVFIKDRKEWLEKGVELGFTTRWSCSYQTAEHDDSYLLLGREDEYKKAMLPLLVHLPTLDASLFPWDIGAGEQFHSQSFYSHEGHVLCARRHGVTHWQPPATDNRARPCSEICTGQYGGACTLLPYKGWIHYPGRRWYLIHPETLECQLAKIEGEMPEILGVAASGPYGMVVWDSNTLYRVEFLSQ